MQQEWCIVYSKSSSKFAYILTNLNAGFICKLRTMRLRYQNLNENMQLNNNEISALEGLLLKKYLVLQLGIYVPLSLLI